MFFFIIGTFGLDVSYGDTSPDFGRQILSQVQVNENFIIETQIFS